jgi:hypothetical protein
MNQEIRKTGKDAIGSARRLSELPNLATFRVNPEPKNTASGDAAG